ncbi:MAG: hypothetical protein H0W93_07565 [Gammaproteobacteria bacterium]|nr:hypothetical protein [Gammaproteobacteria bacterium]
MGQREVRQQALEQRLVAFAKRALVLGAVGGDVGDHVIASRRDRAQTAE